MNYADLSAEQFAVFRGKYFLAKHKILFEEIMKQSLFALVFLVALSGCAHTTYTEATSADGSTVKHIAIAPGTKITTAAGGCIDSTSVRTTCPAK
ncbi:TPA: lipoprotein [Citrobacter freundii]